jgi:DNA-binding transcriptional regulator YiaG
MANIGKLLKDEIARISKKNAVALTKPLKNEMRSLKLQLRAATTALKTLEAAVRKGTAPRAEAGPEAAAPALHAFTGKGIKSLRRKFKITQAELAKLAKVSSQAVVMWERKPGRIRLRHATHESLCAIRLMRKADVKAALGSAPAGKKG